MAMIAVIAVLVLVVRQVYSLLGPPLILNYTDSEPHGLYWLDAHRNHSYASGQLVVFPVPRLFETLIYGRGWLGPGLPLMKGIGAVEGDRVCTDDRHASVNGLAVGPIFAADSAGRPLPKIRGCYTVPAGYFVPFSAVIARSFDGRYMGPQPLDVIVGEVHPLWTF